VLEGICEMARDIDLPYSDEIAEMLASRENTQIPIFIIFLIPFIIAAISVASLPGANYFVNIIGVICTIAYLIASLEGGFIFPPEVLLFWSFVLWAFPGIFVAGYTSLLIEKLYTLLQFSIMLIFLAHYSKNTRAAEVLFFSALIGCLIIAVSAYVTGEYARAESEGERVAGLAMGANGFAMRLVYATVVILCFFRAWRSWFLKGVLILMLLVMASFIIASGSRAGFIGFVVLCGAWFVFSYGIETLRRPAAAFAGLIVLIGIMYFLFSGLGDTVMGKRLLEVVGVLQGEAVVGGGSLSSRLTMIEDGLKLMLSHPLFGIGLNQFAAYSGGFGYAHSNYVEVFSATGIPGGILYYSIFVVVFLRLRRLGKLPLETRDKAFIDASKACVFMQLVSDIAVVSYYDKTSWIIFAIIIGWSYQFERRIQTAILTNVSEPADELQIQQS
jgi:O-antigen ligase